MTLYTYPRSWRLFLAVILFTAPILKLNAQDPELRGLWIDAFGAGYKTSAQVDQLIADAKTGNYNAIFPQIRKRGDAYYNSFIEPKATDINANYDPLADLIQKAHAANIKVHAWLVVYPLWSLQNTPPSQPTHVYNVHPGWLTQNSSGNTWDGSHYQLDPGHPQVQQHIHDIVMDIATRYNVNGIQLDYIRYSGRAWGYNPVTVQRFNTIYGRSGLPGNNDADWLQFRRDQVTDLVRKVYLSALAHRYDLIMSASTITWGSGITTTAQWPNSSAYSTVLQDWRAWMQEGIVDLNIPMVYFDHATHAQNYNDWNIFAKNHRYNRHMAIGPGHYLNSISDSMTQIRQTRVPTAAGNKADGVISYSYRSHNNQGASRAAFLAALSDPTEFIVDNSDGGFSASSNWTTSTSGTQKYASNFRIRSTQSVSDPATWTVNLPAAGQYEIYAWWTSGSNRATAAPYIVTHSSGTTTVNRNQQSNGGQWNSLGTFHLNAGSNQVRLSCWTSSGSVVVADALRWRRVSGGGPFSAPAALPIMAWKTNPQTGHLKGLLTRANGSAVDGATVSLTGPVSRTGRSGATGFYGFVDLPAGNYTVTATLGGVSRSGSVTISKGSVATRNLSFPIEIIVDNSDPGFSASGNWSTANWAGDKYGADYRHRSTQAISDAASWTTNLPSSGTYRVSAWWSASSNRASAAPYIVDHAGGSQTLHANQQANGGRWNVLGDFQMNAGAAQVRLSCWTTSGDIVIADAVKWERIGN